MTESEVEPTPSKSALLNLPRRVIHEIDIPNMIHIVNGVDQMAKQRAALGM